MALCVYVPAASAAAQTISGTVLDSDSGSPIAGALVSAISASGDTTPIVVTTGAGRFVLPLRRDVAHELLVRFIGMLPSRTKLPGLSAGADSAVTIRMTRLGQTLATVHVAEVRRCVDGETGIGSAADVWSQIAAALESSRINYTQVRRPFDYVLFERVSDPGSARSISSRSDTLRAVTERPFIAVGRTDLAERGYVLMQVDAIVFRAPDETVLLDQSFLASHCFWTSVGSGTRAGQVALHFKPLDDASAHDIAGTFWVDAVSSQLRSLDFNYTRRSLRLRPAVRRTADSLTAAARQNAPEVDARLTPGGSMEFEQMADGLILITSWILRATDNWIPTDVGGEPLPAPNIIRERGGTILKRDDAE